MIKQKENKKFEYYNIVLDYAKENGVKGVRKSMKLVNIIAKIKAAGLEVPKREEVK